jgi:hypothetical protein
MPYRKSVVSGGPTPGDLRFVPVADREIPQRYQLVWTPDDDEPGPAVRIVFEVIDGVPQTREVHYEATAHGREIRRHHLDFPVEDYLEEATVMVGQFAEMGYGFENGQSFVVDMASDPFRREIQRVRAAQRRRGPTDAQLREAADVYAKTDHAPVVAVGERFGIERRTASKWIKLAREKGFLS